MDYNRSYFNYNFKFCLFYSYFGSTNFKNDSQLYIIRVLCIKLP